MARGDGVGGEGGGVSGKLQASLSAQTISDQMQDATAKRRLLLALQQWNSSPEESQFARQMEIKRELNNLPLPLGSHKARDLHRRFDNLINN